MNNFKQYVKLAQNKLIERLLILISLLTLANLVFFPVPTFADTDNSSNNQVSVISSFQLVPDNQGNSLIQIINPEVMVNADPSAKDAQLPQNKPLATKYSVKTVLTAYNSEVGQTDNTPCITASGFDLCKHGVEDSVAINGIKMGTKVRFPDLFGNKVFVVRDRMNSRYGSSRVDVWMLSKADAKDFGVKIATMEVLE